jgi:hypothetical protein
MRVRFPRLCTQHGRSQHRAASNALVRSRTTYTGSAPNVVGGRVSQAGRTRLRQEPCSWQGPGRGIFAVGSDAYQEVCRRGGSVAC